MANTPLVSVIIPTYNRASFLRDVSIPSVLRQSYKNLEVIIVDDGSTDDTKKNVDEIISKEKNIPIAYVYRENGGQGAARNTAIKRAQGEWILPLDSDDALMPDGVEQLLEKALNSAADIVCGQTWRVCWKTKKIVGIGGATPSSVLLRRKVFDDFGLYDESRDFIGVEDVDHLYRLQPFFLNKRIKVADISRPTAIYFLHGDQTTSLLNPGKLLERTNAIITKWERRFPHNRQWKINMAHQWRNKGSYELLMGRRRDGLLSLRYSLKLRLSVVAASSFLGGWLFERKSFRFFAVMLRNILLQFMGYKNTIVFYLTHPSVASLMKKEVKTMVDGMS